MSRFRQWIRIPVIEANKKNAEAAEKALAAEVEKMQMNWTMKEQSDKLN